MKKKVLSNENSEIVTRDILKEEFIKFNAKILEQVRFSIYEANENMKVYHEVISKRHMTALLEGFRDELKVYKDELISVRKQVEVLENKIAT